MIFRQSTSQTWVFFSIASLFLFSFFVLNVDNAKAKKTATTTKSNTAPKKNATPKKNAGNPKFHSITQSFLKKNCLECHDKETQEGKQAFHELKEVTESNLATWQLILEQIQTGQMPPDQADKKHEDRLDPVKAHQFGQTVLDEFQTLLKKSGGYHKYDHPSKGNYLDHDLIFNTDIKKIALQPASTPARMWRIHPHAYLVRHNELVHFSPKFNPQRPGLLAIGDALPSTALPRDYNSRAINLGADHSKLFKYSSGEWIGLLPTIQMTLGLNGDRGLQNYSKMYSISSAETNQLISNARLLLGYMINGPDPRRFCDSRKPPKGYQDRFGKGVYTKHYFLKGFKRKQSPVNEIMNSKNAPSQKSLEKAVTYFYEKLIFRAPSSGELKDATEYLKQQIKSLGKEQGLINGLTPIFLHPEALFNHELAEEGTADKHGRVQLTGHELALAINSAFSYLPPNDRLRKAVDSGKLKTREDVRREVAHILNTPSIRKPRVLRFFQEYFDYHRAPFVDKDDDARITAGIQSRADFHILAAVRMMGNTDRLVEYFLEKDKHILTELLTTNKAIIGLDKKSMASKPKQHAGKPDGVANWGHFTEDGFAKKFMIGNKGKAVAYVVSKGVKLPVTKGKDIYVREPWSSTVAYTTSGKSQLVTLPTSQRMGILTDPSWLLAHSDAMDNHAVLRGRWIRERLLGGAVPDVPVTVDAKLPEEPKSTLRHRMRVTRKAECWKCHQRMDPLGLPFEMYNHMGLYRTKELGKPVDTTGNIVASGDPKIDGPVKNAIEMVRKLAKSERVHQVFVRHVFRYWMGRNETINDIPTLRAAYKAYKDNDESMNALLTSLLTSDSFLYRKVK